MAEHAPYFNSIVYVVSTPRLSSDLEIKGSSKRRFFHNSSRSVPFLFGIKYNKSENRVMFFTLPNFIHWILYHMYMWSGKINWKFFLIKVSYIIWYHKWLSCYSAQKPYSLQKFTMKWILLNSVAMSNEIVLHSHSTDQCLKYLT